MYPKGTRRSLELSCSQTGVFGETDRTVAVAAHTWSWWSPSHADTEYVCLSLCTCVWVCTVREFFGQAERLHLFGLRENVVRTHQVSTCMRSIRGGLRWLWQPFHVRVGDILIKQWSTLCCVRQNCTSLLENYSIPWDIINSLDVASSLCVDRIIINYHQISKFKSSLMLDVKRCASRLLLA